MNRRSLTVAILALAAWSSGASAQFAGTIRWTDEDGATHKARKVTVQIYAIVPDEDGVPTDVLIDSVLTDYLGDYSSLAVNPDGTLGNFMIVRAMGTAASVAADSTSAPYGIGSGGVGDLTIGNASNAERAFAVHDALVTGAHYAELARPAPTAALRCEFPWPTTGVPPTSHYNPSDDVIRILQDDRWDWDVNLHEYSHYLGNLDDLDDSPGGKHYLGVSNIGQEVGDLPVRTKDQGTRLAWGEGLGNFLGIAMQHVDTVAQNIPAAPRVGNMRYEDTIDSTNDFSLETHAGSGEAGEGDEVSVARILWDIADPVGGVTEPKDRVSKGYVELYQILDTSIPGGPTQLEDVWNYFTGGSGDDKTRADFGAIFEEYGVSPEPTAVTGDTYIMSDPAPTFSWFAQNNGASETFGLIVFDALWNRLLDLTVPGIGVTDYTLSALEWSTLTDLAGLDGPQSLRFVVTGSDLIDPDGVTAYAGVEATGAYWSDAYSFTLIPGPGTMAFVGMAGALGVVRRKRR